MGKRGIRLPTTPKRTLCWFDLGDMIKRGVTPKHGASKMIRNSPTGETRVKASRTRQL
jgi:hypothetical protein